MPIVPGNETIVINGRIYRGGDEYPATVESDKAVVETAPPKHTKQRKEREIDNG